MAPTVIWVQPGQVWRARLLLSGPTMFAKTEDVRTFLEANGFEHAWAWESPPLPGDWPTAKRADISDLFEKQMWVQAYVGKADEPSEEPRPLPTEGNGWRLHDWWMYLEHAAPPTVHEPPPADVGEDAGKPAGNLDVWAKQVLRQAYLNVMGREPTPEALQTIQAVGRNEGVYGWASKPPQWAGRHNWGAIMCGSPKNGECKCGFSAGDGYYLHGQWNPFQACFESQPTNLRGAERLVEVLVKKRSLVQAVQDSGDLIAFTRAMRDTSYFCRTMGKAKGQPSCQAATDEQKQQDALWYAKILERHVKAIAAATGDPQFAFYDENPMSVFEDDGPPSAARSRVGFAVGVLMFVAGAGLAAGACVWSRRASR